MRWIYCAALMFAVPLVASARPSRVLRLSDTEVGQIATSLGYSTILQFDSKPTSVVLGDQDAFKVEYLADSLTIKPLVAGVRTNLFVFTQYERFNFRVEVRAAAQADYVVRIRRKETRDGTLASSLAANFLPSPVSQNNPGERLNFKQVGKSEACNGLRLNVDSFAVPEGKPWTIITFSLGIDPGVRSGALFFEAKDISVLVSGKPTPIETTYVEHLTLLPNGRLTQGSLLLYHTGRVEDLAVQFIPSALKDGDGGCRTLRVPLRTSSKKRK